MTKSIATNSEDSLNDMLECQDEVVNLNTSEIELNIQDSMRAPSDSLMTSKKFEQSTGLNGHKFSALSNNSPEVKDRM